MPSRIQLSRAKGWRKPPGAVTVSRPAKWGNPYGVSDHGRDEAVRLYRAHVLADPALLAAVRAELPGRDLACWCAPGLPCHADVLIELANGDR